MVVDSFESQRRALAARGAAIFQVSIEHGCGIVAEAMGGCDEEAIAVTIGTILIRRSGGEKILHAFFYQITIVGVNAGQCGQQNSGIVGAHENSPDCFAYLRFPAARDCFYKILCPNTVYDG